MWAIGSLRDSHSVEATGVVLGVHERERAPLFGELVAGEARIDWASLDASVAVNALLGVDEELVDVDVLRLVGRRVDAVHRAHLDARIVLRANAGLGDDVGHECSYS